MKQRKRDVINEKISFANFVCILVSLFSSTDRSLCFKEGSTDQRESQTNFLNYASYIYNTIYNTTRSFITDIAFLFYITYYLY